MSHFSWPYFLQTCLVLLVVLCILVPSDVTGSPVGHVQAKRGGSARRYPRARYRVGYMFGKRSSSVVTSSKLFDAISRELLSQKDLASLLRNDPELLEQVISHLDKDDNGYITVSDFL